MIKSIKKSIKYLIIGIGIMMLVITVLYSLIRLPEVQTFIVRRITSHLSNEIKSTITVGKIEFSFFNKLTINDLLIKDKHNDTLIYLKNASTGIRRIDFRNKIFRLGKAELNEPLVAFITDSTGLMNLKWYIEMLKASKDPTRNTETTFTANQIIINEGSFRLFKNTDNKSKTVIDFNDLKLREINGNLEYFEVKSDTVRFDLNNLGFRESHGFAVNELSTKVMIAGQDLIFNSVLFSCDSSSVNLDHIGLLADAPGSFSNFTEKVRLDLLLQKSLLSTSDLQYFIPFLTETNDSLWLSGRVNGTISELRGRNLELSYGDSSYLACDFDFSGLPVIGNAFIYIGVNTLTTNASDISRINIPGKGALTVPDFIHKLGNISFKGTFTGFTTDFVTYGKIGTAIGNISTDISFRPEEKNKFRIKGLLTGSNIDLGEISGNHEMFGKLSMETNIDGYASSAEEFAGNLTGRVDSIEINSYNYRNIALNGVFTEKTWDGSINITDRNIKMDLLGMFNFREKLPEFDFTLNLAEVDLYRLNFDKADTTSSLTALLTANFKGNNIDNLDGEIKLLNSTLRKFNNKLELYDFSIKTFTEADKPAINLRTDFVDADLRGYYNFTEIGTLTISTLATLMPSRFSAPVVDKSQIKNNFTFNINFKNTDKINNFFKTGILLAEKSYLTGAVYSDSIIWIDGRTRMLSVKNNVFEDLTITGNISEQMLTAELKSSSLLLVGQAELNDLAVRFGTKPDSLSLSINWDNKDKILNKGEFIAYVSIFRKEVENDKVVMKIDIEPSKVYTRNNLWKINRSEILIDSNTIDINRMYINNKENYYLVNGRISEDPGDTLQFEFEGLDLSPFNKTDNNNNNETLLPLNLKGILSGKILLTNFYRNMLLESNININDFSLLGSEYGDISVTSVWNNTEKVADINVSNNLKGTRMFDIGGNYNPETGKIDLNLIATRLPVDALNPLLKSFASGISGYASGKLNLSGELDKLVLSGAIMAENTSLKIDYLQTTYRFNDTIRLDKSGIKFNNIRLKDERGNNATLTGSVNHKYFKNFRADLLINTYECQVLNTKPKDNELFYGTAFASGVTTIKSGPNSISFDISAKTNNNTKLFIPLNTSLSVSEYSYITFVGPDSTVSDKYERTIPVNNSSNKNSLDLNLDLEVTPDAEVELIIDSKAGDVMSGHGSGKLNINLNPNGDFRILGDYIIEEGEYLFTLGNILNKSFSVENGGRISFNGDVEDAEIDIKAIYTLKARLYEILKDEQFTERIPIECQLNLSGKLFNPIVGFNIYLPMADEETRTRLKNMITTEEELSRQFLYLLVMNSFYADASYGSSSGSTATGTSAMAVTTTEMLSNQLSNWLSQISNDFDIGFVYRPGYKNINSQELQVALSTQLLNDKVFINSNLDVRELGSSKSNTNQITGDFDLEYKITEKFRFRVFNRFNNPYTGKGVPYTQGIGFFFRQDFDKLTDLFKKKQKSDMKKEDEITLPE